MSLLFTFLFSFTAKLHILLSYQYYDIASHDPHTSVVTTSTVASAARAAYKASGRQTSLPLVLHALPLSGE